MPSLTLITCSFVKFGSLNPEQLPPAHLFLLKHLVKITRLQKCNLSKVIVLLAATFHLSYQRDTKRRGDMRRLEV